MIKADEALTKLRDFFDSSGLQYEVVDVSSEAVHLRVVCDKVSLMTEFDVPTQQWGFALLQGGLKLCEDFNAFVDYLETYININTVLIPQAKQVADAFESEVGISTVYDSFSGNKQSGYTVKFRILGVDNECVLIKKIPEGYKLRSVILDKDSSKYKVKLEYKYEISADGTVTAIPTIHSFMHELSKRYDSDSNVTVERVDENLFKFVIEGMTIRAKVELNYLEIRYIVQNVDGYVSDLLVVPQDPYDLSAVYMQCKDYFDSCFFANASDVSAVDEAVAEEVHEELQKESEEVRDDDKYGVGIETSMLDDCEEDAECSPEPLEHESEEHDMQESALNVQSVKVVLKDGKSAGVQFIVNDIPYIFSEDEVNDAGLPVNRISDSVQMKERLGVCLTEDELRLKRGANPSQNSRELLEKIISAIFE